MESTHYSHVLKSELERRIQTNPNYSLRSFAKALAISPGSLSLILAGKKIPSVRLAKKIVDGLGLSPRQKKEFLGSLFQAHEGRTLQRKNSFLKAFQGTQTDFVQPEEVQELSLNVFQVISDWHHYAIMMLLETEGAKADPRWIAQQIDISPMEARFALDRLTSLGLIKIKRGKWSIDCSYLTTADKSITTPALKKHQRQVLEKAIQSLEKDPIEARSISSLTMAVDPERISKAREMIEEFSQRLCTFLEGGKRTQVYELGISLFPLQKRSLEQ